MSRKYELISELYDRTCKTVVSNPQNWQNFLQSACRNYKLRYDEQLLIYAQRPDATAVLEIERWNRSFGRWVNKGAKTKGAAIMNEITYTMVGDYNLPNLTLPEQPEVIQGKWSQMRRTYLKEHHKVQYYNLLTKGILSSHLSEVQQRATELEETLIRQMAQQEGLTEQMKADDMMKWVRLMNNIRNSAQEIVKEQIIFI